MASIRELDIIRTTVPLEGADVFDETRVYPLPAGSTGTVVCDFGSAYEVEFLVRLAQGADASVQITVEGDQCELAQKAS